MKKLVFLSLIITIIFISGCNNNKFMDKENVVPKKAYNSIRQPAVAGIFYPDNPDKLKGRIESYLANADLTEYPTNVRAIMVPHAGYDYSGQVAAYAYKLIQDKRVGTVVIMSNAHSAYFDGIAIDDNEAWQTPLGTVELNLDLAEKLVAASKLINFNKEAHASDHTLEVQVPFLQTVLGEGFKILPILFGGREENARTLAEILGQFINEDDLLVVSTDLSHYPFYNDANKIDPETLNIITQADIDKLDLHIKDTLSQGVPSEETLCCGITGVKTVLRIFRDQEWEKIKILHYANSGDVFLGDKSRVVGYGVLAFLGGRAREASASQEIDAKLNKEQQEILLNIARRSVEAEVRGEKLAQMEVQDERLNWQEGAFVTLKLGGQLRGCIGQIIPNSKPLWQVVSDMAVAACSQDHRFDPIKEGELEQLEYEVSVLSAPRTINNWQEVELGKHGVIVRQGWQSGVFLPQVADETGWSKEEFLSQLCSQKAGLSPDCYKNNSKVELQVFTAQVF